MQSSPYLQQHFYFVSEHGLNRHRVRNKRFARNSFPERGASRSSALRESAGSWGATICLQVVSPREAYNRYTRDIKYRTRKGMTEVLRRGGNERGMISTSSIRFYRALSNGDKSAFRPDDTKRPEFPSSAVVFGITLNNRFVVTSTRSHLISLSLFFYFFFFKLRRT